jgi:hypothetical protein
VAVVVAAAEGAEGAVGGGSATIPT